MGRATGAQLLKGCRMQVHNRRRIQQGHTPKVLRKQRLQDTDENKNQKECPNVPGFTEQRRKLIPDDFDLTTSLYTLIKELLTLNVFLVRRL